MAKKAKKPATKKAKTISLGGIIKAIDAVEKEINRVKKKAPQNVVAELEVNLGKLNEAKGLLLPQCAKKPTLTIFPL